MRSKALRSLMASAITVGAIVAASSANAAGTEASTQAPADPSAPATAGTDTAKPDDGAITVTAQKRVENIQDVPISIAAFSGTALQRSNVVTIQDLGRVATNFQASKGVQSSFIRINIRGIGAAGNTTIEPSVASFVDGIYVPRAGAIVSGMLDMESVEVLRGPQGTLFGRNASVGALSLHTAAPRSEFGGSVTGEVGNGDRYKLTGIINVPLSNSVAVRVAGQQQWFGGYWRNALDGRQLGGTDDTQLRGSVRFHQGKVEWIVRADYSKSAGDGFTNLDFDPSSVSPAQLAALQARLGGVLPDTNLKDNVLNQYVTADLNDRQWGVSSHFSYDLNGSTLRLINSYRDWHDDQLDGDVIFTPVPIVSRTGSYRSKSQNHELQFISPSRQWLNGHLDLVAGLYYFHENYRLDEQLHMNSQYCNVLVAAGPGRTACNSFLTSNGGHNATDQDVLQSVNSYAAYSQATVHLAKPLSLTLGGRFTRDEKTGSYAQRTSNPFVAPLRAPEVLTFPDVNEQRFTYRVGLNYEPTDDLLFFTSYSTGYKSGGYNSGAGSPALSTFDAQGNLISTKRLFGPETTKDYELGAKTSWLDHAVTANLTFYRMDISGYQDRAFDGTSFTVRNAGNLRQQGFELDTILRPVRHFTIDASVAYLDSQFTSYPNAAGLPGLGGVQDLKGKPVSFSPKWTGRIGVDWTGALSGGWTWDINTNMSFVSQQYLGLVNDGNPQTIEPSYNLFGARFTINGPGDRWSASIFGNNLTNTQYSPGNLYQVLDAALGVRNGIFPGSTAVRRLHADPRTYGASVTVRF